MVSILLVIRRRFVCIFAKAKIDVRLRPAVGGNSPPDCCILSFESPLHSKKDRYRMVSILFGDPPEIRTPDPLLKRQLLCQLS